MAESFGVRVEGPMADTLCRRRVVVADQLEFIVRGDAGIDEQVGDDRNDRGTELHQERRQPGQ